MQGSGADGAALPLTGVIIVNYRTPALALESAAAIAAERAHYPSIQLVLVDGGSADGSADEIAAGLGDPRFAGWARPLPLPVNGGFGFANNRAIELLTEDRTAVPEVICLINPDARVCAGAIAALARRLQENERIGAVGALLVHEDGTPQGSAFAWPTIRGEFLRGVRTGFIERLLGGRRQVQGNREAPADWVTGAAVAFRTKALEEVGLFDEGFFLYYEETELMHRLARAGWEIWHEPAARVVHLAGASTGLRDPETGVFLAKRVPRYWYDARRRYFALTHGAAGTAAAGLAWLSGRLAWQLRCLLTRRQDEEAPHATRDFIRFSFLPRRGDTRAHIRRVGDPPADRPAWMTQG